MGLFSNFVDRVMAKKIDKTAQKFEQAGAQAVSLARDLVPVKTGNLQASLYYEWNRQTMTLTIGAHAPYGVFVERGTRRMAARPYLAPAMRQVFREYGMFQGQIQFATTPAKYQAGYQAQADRSSGPRTIVGNRPRAGNRSWHKR